MSGKEKYEPKKITVVYADEQTRMSYEVEAAVKRFNQIHPEEPYKDGQVIILEPIRFTPEDDYKGNAVLFWVDDFMETNEDETVFFVKPRTLEILSALGVQYENARVLSEDK